MPDDPKPRQDQTCVQCRKPKTRTRSTGSGKAPAQATYTRINRRLWLAELDRDPFCSRECCEAWAGTNEAPATRVCAHVKCANSFAVRRDVPRRRFCCKRCKDDAQKARKYDVPGRCAGCGGEMEGFSAGCTHCMDRRRTRLRRAGEDTPVKPRSNAYATEEERVAARRRSWRETKRRKKERLAA